MVTNQEDHPPVLAPGDVCALMKGGPLIFLGAALLGSATTLVWAMLGVARSVVMFRLAVGVVPWIAIGAWLGWRVLRSFLRAVSPRDFLGEQPRKLRRGVLQSADALRRVRWVRVYLEGTRNVQRLVCFETLQDGAVQRAWYYPNHQTAWAQFVRVPEHSVKKLSNAEQAAWNSSATRSWGIPGGGSLVAPTVVSVAIVGERPYGVCWLGLNGQLLAFSEFSARKDLEAELLASGFAPARIVEVVG